jgi:hypothetical protein
MYKNILLTSMFVFLSASSLTYSAAVASNISIHDIQGQSYLQVDLPTTAAGLLQQPELSKRYPLPTYRLYHFVEVGYKAKRYDNLWANTLDIDYSKPCLLAEEVVKASNMGICRAFIFTPQQVIAQAREASTQQLLSIVFDEITVANIQAATALVKDWDDLIKKGAASKVAAAPAASSAAAANTAGAASAASAAAAASAASSSASSSSSSSSSSSGVTCCRQIWKSFTLTQSMS